MAADIETRIAALKAKKDKLAVQLVQLQGKAKTEERKRQTRRKIVVGGTVLVAMEKDPTLRETVRRLLAATVTRQKDREVLADLLPPMPPLP